MPQIPEPFLLIVRTGRIFTTHVQTLKDGCDMDEYRRILGVSSICSWTFVVNGQVLYEFY